VKRPEFIYFVLLFRKSFLTFAIFLLIFFSEKSAFSSFSVPVFSHSLSTPNWFSASHAEKGAFKLTSLSPEGEKRLQKKSNPALDVVSHQIRCLEAMWRSA